MIPTPRLEHLCTVIILCAAAFGAAGQERMPPIPQEQMSDAQKKIVADMVSSQRGRLPPPMVPMLRSPELMTRIGGLGDYILFHNSLNPRIFEQTVMLVAPSGPSNSNGGTTIPWHSRPASNRKPSMRLRRAGGPPSWPRTKGSPTTSPRSCSPIGP